MKKKSNLKNSKKTKKTLSLPNNPPAFLDPKDLEITRLKAELSVVKGYYSTLIGKNLAKIEQVVKSFDEYLLAYKEENPTTPYYDRIKKIDQKLIRTKKRDNREFLQNERELLYTIVRMIESKHEDYSRKWHLLRQVM